MAQWSCVFQHATFELRAKGRLVHQLEATTAGSDDDLTMFARDGALLDFIGNKPLPKLWALALPSDDEVPQLGWQRLNPLRYLDTFQIPLWHTWTGRLQSRAAHVRLPISIFHVADGASEA